MSVCGIIGMSMNIQVYTDDMLLVIGIHRSLYRIITVVDIWGII